MMNFVHLFEQLDSTTKTNAKIQAIREYLEEAEPAEKIFSIALLIGIKPKRAVNTTTLRLWASALSGIPLWLLEEGYYVVGDLAETLTLILPEKESQSPFQLEQIYKALLALPKQDIVEQREIITTYWAMFSGTALFLFNKIVTGNFRVGVSRKIVVKGIAQYLQMEEAVVEHRLMGKWDPLQESLESLFAAGQEVKNFLPYPFCLAYPVEGEPTALGPVQDWLLEPKLDGIRGQLIYRQGELYVWSRGEELVTEKFVEFEQLIGRLPQGIVLDGEVIPWKDGQPLDFGLMQTRIGRKTLTKKILEEVPLVMVCYDILEWEGQDIRSWPMRDRRQLLQKVLADASLQSLLKLSQQVQVASWEEAAAFRQEALIHRCEGLMLKHWDSAYEVGRKKGHWWKWKVDPMTVDAVLIYAQSGHGRRANLFTDYTFGVWDKEELVPFAKAYSGLTDKELIRLDNWIKRHTLEKFGPVRRVEASLVFELAFEGIGLSKRHKSGVALRFPRILRWREDKLPKDANTKEDLLQLIAMRHESTS